MKTNKPSETRLVAFVSPPTAGGNVIITWKNIPIKANAKTDTNKQKGK